MVAQAALYALEWGPAVIDFLGYVWGKKDELSPKLRYMATRLRNTVKYAPNQYKGSLLRKYLPKVRELSGALARYGSTKAANVYRLLTGKSKSPSYSMATLIMFGTLAISGYLALFPPRKTIHVVKPMPVDFIGIIGIFVVILIALFFILREHEWNVMRIIKRI